MFNKARINIENKLMIDSLAIYVDELITPYVKDKQYPTLENLLRLRLIKKIEINPNIANRAYLKKADDCFILTTREQLDLDRPLDRFILAHEIAHTFLYKIKSERILDNMASFKNSLEQEYFCNFFARALLIPTKELEKDINQIQEVKSLKLFNKLSIKYNVPYQEILKRTLNDLELIKDIVIIRFAKFLGELNWKVYETFMSESIRYDNKYYIPSNNHNKSIKYSKRFPTCCEKLSEYLSKLSDQMNLKEELLLKNHDLDAFKGKPLEHFSKNLSSSFTFIATKSHVKRFNTKMVNIMVNLKDENIPDLK